MVSLKSKLSELTVKTDSESCVVEAGQGILTLKL